MSTPSQRGNCWVFSIHQSCEISPTTLSNFDVTEWYLCCYCQCPLSLVVLFTLSQLQTQRPFAQLTPHQSDCFSVFPYLSSWCMISYKVSTPEKPLVQMASLANCYRSVPLSLHRHSQQIVIHHSLKEYCYWQSSRHTLPLCTNLETRSKPATIDRFLSCPLWAKFWKKNRVHST